MKFFKSGMVVVFFLMLMGCPKSGPREMQQPEAADAAGVHAIQPTGTAQAQAVSPLDGASSESSHRRAVRELFKLMNTSKLAESMKVQLKQMILQSVSQEKIPEQKKAIVEKYMSQMVDLMTDSMDWQALEPEFIDLYVTNFSESEINDMLVFFQSPTGTKWIEKTPLIMQRSMAIGQRQAQRMMPEINKLLEKMKKEIEQS